MSHQAIAHNYAQAFFEAAKDADLLEPIHEDARILHATFKSEPQLLHQLSSPGISQNDRMRIISLSVQSIVNELTRNFLLTVIRHRRQFLLVQILEELEKLLEQKNQVLKAKLTSAHPLDTDQCLKLQSIMEKKSGYILNIEYSVDPKLLGGFILRYGDTMVDCSTGSALNRFRNTLKSLRY